MSQNSKRPIGAAVAALALLAVACGTRADFTAAPQVRSTQTIDEVIGGTGQKGSAGSAGSLQTISSGGIPNLRPGSGIQGGVIKVGGLFPLSGGLSALGVPPAQAASAYFRWVNDHGGINGYKIDFEPCDDQAEDTQSQACTERLINKGMFVMGPSFTPFSTSVVPMLERRGVPWVGYDGINIEGFSSKLVVTVGAPIETFGHAMFPYWYHKIEKQTGAAPAHIGTVYLDAAPARTYVREVTNVICPKLGCTLDPVVSVDYYRLDYSSICLQFQNANVDAVWIVTDPASAVKFLVQCRELHYKPRAGWLGQHGVYLNLTVDQSGSWSDGMIANSALLPASVDAPPVRTMKHIVGTYEQNIDFGYFTELGYASAQMTVDVIRRALQIDPKLSRASVLKAAAQLNAYDCHGLCRQANLAPPAAVNGGNHWIWMVRAKYDQSKQDQWVLDGGPVDAWRSETWPRPGRP
jgi:branched-chain amino acid transport system substrate-binding protein